MRSASWWPPVCGSRDRCRRRSPPWLQMRRRHPAHSVHRPVRRRATAMVWSAPGRRPDPGQRGTESSHLVARTGLCDSGRDSAGCSELAPPPSIFPGAAPRPPPPGQQCPGLLTAEAQARTDAITWILAQVSRAAVVSCDPQICADQSEEASRSAKLLTLGPGSTDPLGSALVVATAAVRAQFGIRLATVYAPATIASFGSNNARIDIRLVSSRRSRQLQRRSADGTARQEGGRGSAAGEQPDRGLGLRQGTTSQRRC